MSIILERDNLLILHFIVAISTCNVLVQRRSDGQAANPKNIHLRG